MLPVPCADQLTCNISGVAIVDNVALYFPVVHVVGLKITIQPRPKIWHDSPPWGGRVREKSMGHWQSPGCSVAVYVRLLC